jgi:hypothetical protein
MASNMAPIHPRRGNPWRLAIWGTAVFLLALPMAAMQFTDEVAWTLRDFLTWGAMLAVARAMVATAVAQAMVAVVAVVILRADPRDPVGVCAMFVVLWLASSALFRKAARQHRPTR